MHFTTLSRSRVDIIKVISHQDKKSDAAIIKLKSPLTFNSRVKPACLPNPSFAPEKNGEVAGIVSGWGRLYEGNVYDKYPPNTYLSALDF